MTDVQPFEYAFNSYNDFFCQSHAFFIWILWHVNSDGRHARHSLNAFLQNAAFKKYSFSVRFIFPFIRTLNVVGTYDSIQTLDLNAHRQPHDTRPSFASLLWTALHFFFLYRSSTNIVHPKVNKVSNAFEYDDAIVWYTETPIQNLKSSKKSKH